MLLCSFALAASQSIADAAPCEPSYVSAIVPQDARIDAPLDASPAVVISPGSCGGETSYSATLTAEDGSVVATDSTDLLDPILELEATGYRPGSTYHVHIEATGAYAGTYDSTFTAGNAPASVTAVPPAAVEASFTWSGVAETGPGILTVRVDARAGDDPTGMAVLGLFMEGLTPSYVAPGAANVNLVVTGYTDEPAGEVCAQLGQRDAVGTWTNIAVCGEPEVYPYFGDTGSGTGSIDAEGACGCATGPSASGVLLTVLAALWARRR